MIFNPARRVAYDALEDFKHRSVGYVKPGLFEHFTPDGVLKVFSAFHEPARNRPVTFQRLTGTLHQQDRIAAKNQRTDARQRMFRIPAANSRLLLPRRGLETPRCAR